MITLHGLILSKFNSGRNMRMSPIENYRVLSPTTINVTPPAASVSDNSILNTTDSLSIALGQHPKMTKTTKNTKKAPTEKRQVMTDDVDKYNQLIDLLNTLESQKRIELFWGKMMQPFKLIRDVMALRNQGIDGAEIPSSAKIFSVPTLILTLKQFLSVNFSTLAPYLALGFVFKNYHEARSAHFPQIEQNRKELEKYSPYDAVFLHRQKEFWGLNNTLMTLSDVTNVEKDSIVKEALARVEKEAQPYIGHMSSEMFFYGALWSMGVNSSALTALKTWVTVSYAASEAKSLFSIYAERCIDVLNYPAYAIKSVTNTLNWETCKSVVRSLPSLLSVRGLARVGATISMAAVSGLLCHMILPSFVGGTGLYLIIGLGSATGAYLGSNLAYYALNTSSVRAMSEVVQNNINIDVPLTFSVDGMSQADFDLIEKFCIEYPCLGSKLVNYFIDSSVKIEEELQMSRSVGMGHSRSLMDKVKTFESYWGELIEQLQKYDQEHIPENRQRLLNKISLMSERFAAIEIKTFEDTASWRKGIIFTGSYTAERAPLESLKVIKTLSTGNVSTLSRGNLR